MQPIVVYILVQLSKNGVVTMVTKLNPSYHGVHGPTLTGASFASISEG
jgi:hypothetical protein